MSKPVTPDELVLPPIQAALDALLGSLRGRSGSVFYSGRAAFSAPSELYILGLNPGGDPVAQSDQTIGSDCVRFYEGQALWSKYADDAWKGAPPGTWGMQPRVLHMLASLEMDAQRVPASNVIFVRSSTEATIAAEKASLLDACWSVHQAVIDALSVRVLVCFGSTAGNWVRQRLNAVEQVDEFEELNARKWSSKAHRAVDGRTVITVSHPSRANWCNPACDPTPLVRRALKGASRSRSIATRTA